MPSGWRAKNANGAIFVRATLGTQQIRPFPTFQTKIVDLTPGKKLTFCASTAADAKSVGRQFCQMANLATFCTQTQNVVGAKRCNV
jgi:hypothetical protein